MGRLTTRKGLREFVELALPSIVNAEPEAILVVIGEAPKDSLGTSIQTVESIKAQAERSGVANHIKFLGVITDKVILATAYESADVHVFPVRHIPGDPESLGMVAVEAAAHGVLTVAFATDGVVDAVSDGKTGYLVVWNNYVELANQVLKVLREPTGTEEIHGFGWNQFGQAAYTAIAATFNKAK